MTRKGYQTLTVFTMTLSLCPRILSVLLMRTPCRFLILMDSPSICIQVISSPSGCFILISNGPSPCNALAPERTTRSNARLSSDLKLTNSSNPSSTFCSEKSSCFLLGTAMPLVRQTFRNPAIQLVQLRQTMPQQPAFKGYPSCGSLITESSSSFQLRCEVTSVSDTILFLELQVMDCTVFSRGFMGRKKLRKPMSPYTTLLRKATGVRWRSTVQTTLASSPIPTQLENIFRKDFYGRSISCWLLMSQIVPSGNVFTSTSHISQCPIAAFIHYFTKSPSPLNCARDIFGPLAPHPRLRLKSFPVPIGRIPITTCDRSIPASYNSDNTQGMVPSPPQMTTRQSMPCCWEKERARERPSVREGRWKRSKICSLAV